MDARRKLQHTTGDTRHCMAKAFSSCCTRNTLRSQTPPRQQSVSVQPVTLCSVRADRYTKVQGSGQQKPLRSDRSHRQPQHTNACTSTAEITQPNSQCICRCLARKTCTDETAPVRQSALAAFAPLLLALCFALLVLAALAAPGAILPCALAFLAAPPPPPAAAAVTRTPTLAPTAGAAA